MHTPSFFWNTFTKSGDGQYFLELNKSGVLDLASVLFFKSMTSKKRINIVSQWKILKVSFTIHSQLTVWAPHTLEVVWQSEHSWGQSITPGPQVQSLKQAVVPVVDVVLVVDVVPQSP